MRVSPIACVHPFLQSHLIFFSCSYPPHPFFIRQFCTFFLHFVSLFSLLPTPHRSFLCVCVCVCVIAFLFCLPFFIRSLFFSSSNYPHAPQHPIKIRLRSKSNKKKTNKTQTQINKKRHDQVTRLLTVEQNKGHTSACVCVNLTLPLADSGPRCVLIGRRFSIDDVTVTGAGRLRLVRSFGSVLFIDSFESPLCTMVRRGVTIAELVCSFLRRRRLLLFHSTPSTCLGATPTGLFD